MEGLLAYSSSECESSEALGSLGGSIHQEAEVQKHANERVGDSTSDPPAKKARVSRNG